MMNDTVLIILAGALVTFLARIGGYFVLARFRRIPPRVEAGLNAVPAAVLTAIVTPGVIRGGVAELAALAVVVVLTLRGIGGATSFFAAVATLVGLRAMLG